GGVRSQGRPRAHAQGSREHQAREPEEGRLARAMASRRGEVLRRKRHQAPIDAPGQLTKPRTPGLFHPMRPLSLVAFFILFIASQSGAADKVTLPGGIVFESLKDGTGQSPKATDTVRVYYRGSFPDGREFDSSRGQPV